ncbi:unnamed protein product [Boreogadus saida]
MDHSLMEMRDRFTQMEIRQVELEQQLHTLQSAQTTVQPTTRSKNGERDMSALWTLLRELQDKEETRRAEMSQLNEVVQKLMEEVRKLSCNKQPARGPFTSPEETLPQQQVDDSPNTSAETDQLPSTPPTPNNTTTRCPEDTPTSNEETQNPQIVLLIDSNGRPHHHEPSTHTHTPWSHQPRPTPLLPTPPHTYSQAVSRGNIPSRDRSIHGMLSELYTFLIQN